MENEPIAPVPGSIPDIEIQPSQTAAIFPRAALSRDLIADYNNDRFGGAQSCLCYSPFKSLFFGIGGRVVSCCLNRDMVLGTYPQDSIKEIWEGARIRQMRDYMLDNDLSGGCSACYTHILNRNFGAVVAQKFDGLPENPRYPTSMEFELHNVCNLECEMCNGELSSLIRKRRDKLPAYKCAYDANFVEQLREFIPHLKQTTFFGGEPFLNRIYFDIWDLLIELNPDCEIMVQTNATVTSKKVRDYLSRGNFKIGISLDSIEKETYESIRLNAKFERVMENIEYFSDYSRQRNQSIVFAVCVMKDNWRGLPELVEYARERNSYVYFNTVWSPKELALWYQGARKLKEVCEFYSRFSFAGPDLVDIVNQRNFRGFVSLLNSWQEFMQCYDDADLDFRDSIENPEQNSHAIAKALRENKQFREGVNRTNPFGVDIEKFLESHSHMSELMGGYF